MSASKSRILAVILVAPTLLIPATNDGIRCDLFKLSAVSFQLSAEGMSSFSKLRVDG